MPPEQRASSHENSAQHRAYGARECVDCHARRGQEPDAGAERRRPELGRAYPPPPDGHLRSEQRGEQAADQPTDVESARPEGVAEDGAYGATESGKQAAEGEEPDARHVSWCSRTRATEKQNVPVVVLELESTQSIVVILERLRKLDIA